MEEVKVIDTEHRSLDLKLFVWTSEGITHVVARDEHDQNVFSMKLKITAENETGVFNTFQTVISTHTQKNSSTTFHFGANLGGEKFERNDDFESRLLKFLEREFRDEMDGRRVVVAKKWTILVA